MNQFIKVLQFSLFMLLGVLVGCDKQQMGAKSPFDLSSAEIAECKREGLMSEGDCKSYIGAKTRKSAELGPVQGAPAMPAPPSPPVAQPAAPPPTFFPMPGTGAAPQPPVAAPPSFPGFALPELTPMRGHGGYSASRIVPPCTDSRNRWINTDRMLQLDNSRMTNFFVTVEPLSVFEPCFKDRVDAVVVPMGGRMVQTYAIPEGASVVLIATIPTGCINGTLPSSSCTTAPRTKLTAWRDFGPGLPPERFGTWDATEELSGRMGQAQAPTLHTAQFAFRR